MNGGLPKWKQEGYPLETSEPSNPQPATYKGSFQKHLVVDYEQLKEHLKDTQTTVLDARPAGRFTGKDPEPRAGLSSGHMPSSVSVPAPSLVNADGTLKSESELAAIFSQAENKKLVTSCGSGIMACVLFLGLQQLGKEAAVYDGSWTDYASRKDAVILKSDV